MSFMLYLIGFIIFISGLAYGAAVLGVSHVWIAIGAIILLGLAVFTGAVATRRLDRSAP